MFNLLIILLIAVLVLLAIQLAVLIRLRFLVRNLKKTFSVIKSGLDRASIKILYSSKIKKCQYCKFRNSFLNNDTALDRDTFSYTCAVNNKPIKLTDNCSHFQAEPSLLDKSDLH